MCSNKEIRLIRSNSDHLDFKHLVTKLDDALSEHNGEMDQFYKQFNSIENLSNVVIAYSSLENTDRLPIGIGAFKILDDKRAEIKRVYVEPSARRTGVAQSILAELEEWAAKEYNIEYTVLETSKDFQSAINLYKKLNYSLIENYDQYIGVENSICMSKSIKLE